jgi:hypothetical protein
MPKARTDSDNTKSKHICGQSILVFYFGDAIISIDLSLIESLGVLATERKPKHYHFIKTSFSLWGIQ